MVYLVQVQKDSSHWRYTVQTEDTASFSYTLYLYWHQWHSWKFWFLIYWISVEGGGGGGASGHYFAIASKLTPELASFAIFVSHSLLATARNRYQPLLLNPSAPSSNSRTASLSTCFDVPPSRTHIHKDNTNTQILWAYLEIVCVCI